MKVLLCCLSVLIKSIKHNTRQGLDTEQANPRATGKGSRRKGIGTCANKGSPGVSYKLHPQKPELNFTKRTEEQ